MIPILIIISQIIILPIILLPIVFVCSYVVAKGKKYCILIKIICNRGYKKGIQGTIK